MFFIFILSAGLLVWRGWLNSCAGCGDLCSSGIGWGGQTGSVAFPQFSLTLGETIIPTPPFHTFCTHPSSLVHSLALTLSHPNRIFRFQLYMRIENLILTGVSFTMHIIHGAHFTFNIYCMDILCITISLFLLLIYIAL